MPKDIGLTRPPHASIDSATELTSALATTATESKVSPGVEKYRGHTTESGRYLLAQPPGTQADIKSNANQHKAVPGVIVAPLVPIRGGGSRAPPRGVLRLANAPEL